MIEVYMTNRTILLKTLADRGLPQGTLVQVCVCSLYTFSWRILRGSGDNCGGEFDCNATRQLAGDNEKAGAGD